MYQLCISHSLWIYISGRDSPDANTGRLLISSRSLKWFKVWSGRLGAMAGGRSPANVCLGEPQSAAGCGWLVYPTPLGVSTNFLQARSPPGALPSGKSPPFTPLIAPKLGSSSCQQGWPMNTMSIFHRSPFSTRRYDIVFQIMQFPHPRRAVCNICHIRSSDLCPKYEGFGILTFV